jgi:uncharacterized Zn-binding protein involved in type VI secretion
MTVYINGNKIAKVNVSIAGGVISGAGATTTFIDNNKVSLNGDSVVSHGTGTHASATVIATHNTTVYINSKLIVVDSDPATCSHVVTN